MAQSRKTATMCSCCVRRITEKAMSKQDEVLSALRYPVRRRELLQGRSAAFRIAYKKLVRTGQIVERGIGGRGNPVYSGLPTAVFPVPRYIGGINPADLALLVRSGMS